MRPICTECELHTEKVQSGVSVVTTFLTPPTLYEVWSADLWQCPNCNHKFIAGYGDRPLVRHFEDEAARFNTPEFMDREDVYLVFENIYSSALDLVYPVTPS